MIILSQKILIIKIEIQLMSQSNLNLMKEDGPKENMNYSLKDGRYIEIIGKNYKIS